MKKLIPASLSLLVSKCIVHLQDLHLRMTNLSSSSEQAPGGYASGEYYGSINECARALDIDPHSVRKYLSMGVLKSYPFGDRKAFKITEVAYAVKSNPQFACCVSHLGYPAHSRKKSLSLTSFLYGVVDDIAVIHASYQKFRFFVSIPAVSANDSELIVKTCQKVIKLRHAKKPFKTAPNAN